MADIAKDIVKRFKQLDGIRQPFENRWQHIAENLLPIKADFTRDLAKGDDRRRRIFDSTPERALDIFASSLMGIVANPVTKWFSLATQDNKVNEELENAEWLQMATELTLNAFNEPDAKFYRHLKAALMEIGAFGNGSLMVQEGKNSRVAFTSRPLKETRFAENSRGEIDTVFRLIKMSARQILQREESEGWSVPGKVKECARTDPDKEFEIIHAMFPREEAKRSDLGKRGMSIASIWVEKDSPHLLLESGFEEMPLAIGRWDIVAGEVYGRGPGDVAIADIKTLHASSKAHIIAAEKVLNPPLQVDSDGTFGQVDLSAGAINKIKGLDRAGGGLQPINTIGSMPLTLEWEQQRREGVLAALFVDQLQLPSTAAMTATEILQRADERSRLIAPSIGSIQAEMIGPIVARTFNLLLRNGHIPPPPKHEDETLNIGGADLKVGYISSLTRAQRFTDQQGILDFVQASGIIAQLNPDSLDTVDYDETVRELAKIHDVPATIMRDAGDVTGIREQRQQQAQLQQQLAAAESVGKSAKDLSSAGVLGSEQA